MVIWEVAVGGAVGKRKTIKTQFKDKQLSLLSSDVRLN